MEVIKRHVELKRAGTGSYMGLCPFHAEKTPSFHVHESRQFFHCFGCGEKGDVFSFVTKIEQRSFNEVLRDLARDAGIELPERAMSPAERQAQLEAESERERMLRAVEIATAFFEEQLKSPAGAAARAYIAGRGISDEIAARFRLGYAPSGWEALQRHLASKQVSTDTAERLGLVGHNDRGRYDFFRDRVMLPVLDRQKRPVGYSSRLLDPEAKDRKYVNSPDSPLFHKKEQLYGFHAALDAIRRDGRAVLVEGNFDVLALHVAGIAEAVAPMGTALTAEQVTMLGRTADRVVVVFDGDQAGERATQKAVALFVESGVDGRIARLPRGQDPDDFVRREGPEAFKKLLDGAKPVVEQFIDDLALATEATIPDRMRALRQAAELFVKVKDLTGRHLYEARLARALHIDERDIAREMRAALSDSGAARREAAAPPPTEVRRTPARDQLDPLVLLVAKPDLLKTPEARRVSELLTDPSVARLCRGLLDSDRMDVPAWLDAGPADVREAVGRAVMDGRFDTVIDPVRTLKDLVRTLEIGRLEQEEQEDRKRLEKAQQEGNQEAVRALLARSMELTRIKQGLKEAPQRP